MTYREMFETQARVIGQLLGRFDGLLDDLWHDAGPGNMSYRAFKTRLLEELR